MIRLVVFDWAGTLIDHGSRAPALAFVEAFRGFGIAATEAEARAPMGLPKRAHIAAMLETPAIRAQWEQTFGAINEGAIDEVYARFVPLNADIAAREAAPVPGVPEALQTLRDRGVMIGSTTGYVREIMDCVLPVASAAGVAPDCVICSDEVPAGRPAPDGVLANMAQFRVTDPAEVLKVDDTAPGIAEGVAAGALAVGITLTGNGAALSASDLAALDPAAAARARDAAAGALVDAGAIATLDSVADLPAWLETQ